MKKFIPLLLVSATLVVACANDASSDAHMRYEIDTGITDTQRLEDLQQSAKRVLESRLIALGEFARDVEVTRTSGGFDAKITLSGSNTAVFDTMTEKLTEPLTITFMVETENLEEADVIVAETEGFNETLLNEDHIDWVTADAHPVTESGEVTIRFTQEGLELKKEIFEEQMDNNIGVFVRNRPVYKMKVEQDDIDSDVLVLRNIPRADMAQIFADDMNVGLHTTFTPVQ